MISSKRSCRPLKGVNDPGCDGIRMAVPGGLIVLLFQAEFQFLPASAARQ